MKSKLVILKNILSKKVLKIQLNWCNLPRKQEVHDGADLADGVAVAVLDGDGGGGGGELATCLGGERKDGFELCQSPHTPLKKNHENMPKVLEPNS